MVHFAGHLRGDVWGGAPGGHSDPLQATRLSRGTTFAPELDAALITVSQTHDVFAVLVDDEQARQRDEDHV